jgi:muramoyltetrapeptide carboxypeptidase
MRIGVVAPGRPIDPSVASRVAAFMALTYPAHEVVFHPQCYLSDGHFAGSDQVRGNAFLEFANDPGFDAVWFARGGYGSNRILHAVMPALGPAAGHKTYLGFSDMGFILGALYARRIGRQVHAAMPITLGRDDKGETLGWALAWLIDGDRRALEPSIGAKPCAAFNLAILTSMIGTPWLPDLTVAARPHRPCADDRGSQRAALPDRPDALPGRARDAIEGHRRHPFGRDHRHTGE